MEGWAGRGARGPRFLEATGEWLFTKELQTFPHQGDFFPGHKVYCKKTLTELACLEVIVWVQGNSLHKTQVVYVINRLGRKKPHACFFTLDLAVNQSS